MKPYYESPSHECTPTSLFISENDFTIYSGAQAKNLGISLEFPFSPYMSHSTHVQKSCDFSLSAEYILNSIVSHRLHSYSHSPSHHASCLSYWNSLNISVLVSAHDLPPREVHPTHSKMNVLKHKSDIPLYRLKSFKHVLFTTKEASNLSFWPVRLPMICPLSNVLTSPSTLPHIYSVPATLSFSLNVECVTIPTSEPFNSLFFQLGMRFPSFSHMGNSSSFMSQDKHFPLLREAFPDHTS